MYEWMKKKYELIVVFGYPDSSSLAFNEILSERATQRQRKRVKKMYHIQFCILAKPKTELHNFECATRDICTRKRMRDSIDLPECQQRHDKKWNH